MILIVVKHPVREQFANEWPRLVEAFTSAARAEPGNVSFDWFRSVDDPNEHLLDEAFADGDPSRAHVESPHFNAVVGALPKWLADVPEIIHAETSADSWGPMAESHLEES